MPGLRTLIILGTLLATFLAFLLGERYVLASRLGRITLRIAVTGTRGKSSVTRLIAGALREAGRRVVAKTTGSAARIILPDGGEQEVLRSGPASILEQKALLRLARRLEAEAVVAEMMSISPECLRAESQKLLRPGVVVLTNVRVDHREEEGRSREEIARSLAPAIGPGCVAFVPESDRFAAFEERAARAGARIVLVPGSGRSSDEAALIERFEFAENIRLALAVTDFLGIPRPVAIRGMNDSRPDLGHLEAVEAKLGEPPVPWTLISAFAANDPESSRRVVEKVRASYPRSRDRMRAVLNLRDDRGDRTLQWLDSIRGGFFEGFESLLLVGSRSVPALERKAAGLARVQGAPARVAVSSETLPEKVTRLLTSSEGRAGWADGLVIGLGNMGGLGERLKAHWESIGERREHGLG